MIKVGDTIAVPEKSRRPNIFQGLSQVGTPGYLEVSPQEPSSVLVRQLQAEEVPIVCEVRRVIEFYSR